MRASAWVHLGVVLLLVVVSASPTAATEDLNMDDFTEFDESALRLLTQGTMWQGFTAGWTSELGKISVYLGTEEECAPATATLFLAKGEYEQVQAVREHQLMDPVVITTTCDASVVCIPKQPSPQCASWQDFVFDSPIPVQEGTNYTFALEVEPSNYNHLPVVGVSPDAANHGGSSSLARSPLFKTRYTQYTFRSFMTSPKPSDGEFGQQTVDPSESPSDTTASESNGDNTDANNGSSGVGVAGIVVPVVVVLVLVAVVVFVVVQRRRWSREKIIDGSQLYALGPMGDDDSDTEGGLRGGRGDRARNRHPIHVRSASRPQRGGEHEDRPKWAEQSWAYGTYSRRLPIAPVETDC